jgi:hypothetical protein
MSGSRSASASVVLDIVGSYFPTISISTTEASSSLFASGKLKLYGTVNWISSFDIKSLNASWAVSDPFVNLETASLSPIEMSLGEGLRASGGIGESSSLTLNLVLLTSVLSVRDSYTFSLSLVSAGGVVAKSSLIVVRNFPPSPGLFSVTPASGIEFSTSFMFSATYWNDVDLPLSYVFGYRPFGSQNGKYCTKKFTSYIMIA